MKIIFMGTPDFAVPCLEKLVNSNHQVCAVFTQPDKPVGRKQILTAPPVKQFTLEKTDIPVYQPSTLKDGEALEIINNYNPDVIVVVAYGKILPKSILASAKYGCVNVHASLLPKYRGAAPIQWSILNGDSETGVTIMQMDEGLDTGDMLMVESTTIDINETSEQLFDRLSIIGADLLTACLDKLELGEISPVKQKENGTCYAEKITKAHSKIDWSKSALQIHNQVRGLQTWPCASTTIFGKAVKIHKTILSNKTADIYGSVVDNKNVLTVCCGDGKCVDILEIQPEGKKKMDTKSFLLGNSVELGTILGE